MLLRIIEYYICVWIHYYKTSEEKGANDNPVAFETMSIPIAVDEQAQCINIATTSTIVAASFQL
jgi:hypothetical protein